MLRQHRQRALQDRRNRLRDLALAGVRRLVSEAIWKGSEWVHLDPALLLGTVLSDPACRYLAFCLGDRLVPVERRRLLAVRELAPELPGLSASVDRARLRFRWRDGRGGLDLRSPDPSWRDREHVLQIVLTPPEPVVTVGMSTEIRSPRPVPSTSWFVDALAELDLQP